MFAVKLVRVVLILAVFGLFLTPGAKARAGLLSYLPFNEGTGTTAYDATSNHIDGTFANGPSWSTAGRFGDAVSFTGDSSQFVYCQNPALNIGTGDFTFSFWFQGGISGNWRRLWNYDSYYGNESGLVDIVTSNQGPQGQQELRVFMGGWGHDVIHGQTTYLDSSTNWYNIVLTRSGTSVRAYINGVQEGTTGTSSQNLTLDTGESLYLGSIPYQGGVAFPGLMDDVAIWNQALTATQIEALAAGTATPSNVVPEPSTIALLISAMVGLLAYAWRRRRS